MNLPAVIDESVTFESLTIDGPTGLPLEFDIAIMNYFHSQVFCKGFFRRATPLDLIKFPQNKPVYFFQNTEPHGWSVAIYSMVDLYEYIQRNARFQ